MTVFFRVVSEKKNDGVSIPNVLWEGQGKSTELHIIGKDTLKRLYITSCFQGEKNSVSYKKHII